MGNEVKLDQDYTQGGTPPKFNQAQ